MKAAVYYTNKDVRVEERPKPEIKEGEILVKVIASGICGTDVMEWYRIKTAPRILGHEMAGDIVESKTDKYKVGQKIFVSHHVPCNECEHCLTNHHTACETLHKTNYDPGGFSEFIRIPKLNIENGAYLLPDNVSYEEGTFIEPLGCVVRGQRAAELKEDDNVLFIGAGISGLLHIKLAKSKGVKKITATDISDYRLEMAKKFGADRVINAKEEIKEKFGKVIVCTGAEQAAQKAFNLVDKGGLLLFFAIPRPDVDITIPITDFWRNEITVKTSYGAAPDDLKEALDIINNKKIDVNDMITHRLSLDAIQKGFNLVAEAKDSLKVIINPIGKDNQ